LISSQVQKCICHLCPRHTLAYSLLYCRPPRRTAWIFRHRLPGFQIISWDWRWAMFLAYAVQFFSSSLKSTHAIYVDSFS
jgi:hypothetical protein